MEAAYESEWGRDVNPNPDSITAADGGEIGGSAAKPAWNKKSNGGSEAGLIMGAELWPALAESARASPKSTSSDSLKVVADGSGSGSVSAAQLAVGSVSVVSSQATNTVHSPTVLSPNQANRQKHTKRSNGFPQAVPPQLEVPPNHAGKPAVIAGESSSYRDYNNNSHKESQSIQRSNLAGSQSPSSSDHNQQQQQRNSFRRNNSFPHPRGEGSYNPNYRGNQDWNSGQRSFGRRDPHMQPPRSFPRGGFVQQRPQHSAAPVPPFIPPLQMPVPLRSFGNHMGFAEVPSQMIYVPGLSPDSLRGVPFVPPLSPHPMFIPGLDPLLPSKIVNQIDYYFSNENLVKDTFLRRNMDEQGWIPVSLIAGFKKVSSLTDNIQLILDSLRSSTIVEVQGERIRRRNDWMRWVLSSSQASSTSSSPHTGARSSPDMLAMQVQNIALG